jgi:phage protein D
MASESFAKVRLAAAIRRRAVTPSAAISNAMDAVALQLAAAIAEKIIAAEALPGASATAGKADRETGYALLSDLSEFESRCMEWLSGKDQHGNHE